MKFNNVDLIYFKFIKLKVNIIKYKIKINIKQVYFNYIASFFKYKLGLF